MPFDEPFRLGPFLVNRRGQMEPSTSDAFPVFHLAWRGHPMHVRLDAGGPAGPGRGTLLLSGVVGQVPSTAGHDLAGNRKRRIAAFALLDGLGGAAEAGWRLRLLPDHRVTVDSSRDIGLPASAVDLLTTITCSLLDLAPYLDLLAEAGLAVEGSGSAASPRTEGTAKT
jgi:hypothetical protein